MNSDRRANVVPLKPPGGDSAPPNSNIFQGIACEKPPRPDWIGGLALDHWDFITDELMKTGQLAQLDAAVLEILCVSYARMREAEEKIAAEGEFQQFKTGVSQLSPWAIAFQRHASRYQKIAKEYGLTIRARKQIEMRDPTQGELEL